MKEHSVIADRENKSVTVFRGVLDQDVEKGDYGYPRKPPKRIKYHGQCTKDTRYKTNQIIQIVSPFRP